MRRTLKLRTIRTIRTMRFTVASLACGLLAFAALAQRGGFGRNGGFPPHQDDESEAPRREAEFHFIRMEYTDLPQFHRGFGRSSFGGMGEGWWIVDWPDADNHFTRGIERLTRIDTGRPAALSHHRCERSSTIPGSMPPKRVGGA